MKGYIKQALRIIIIILIIPLILVYRISCLVFTEDTLFASYSQFLSIIPGKIGSYIRTGFYRYVMEKCDPNCLISFATIFSQVDTEIESGVYIGPQCNIGKCHIEKNCLIGSGVHILSGKHQHNIDDSDTPIKEQGGDLDKITIGEDSWIGNGTIIMADVGRKCVIAAGSIVVNEVEDYSIMAGNPARLIRQRD
jgi:acetyltransferase-like isoleucine patch superfamily enzyme